MPVVCDECGKSYSNVSNLNRHPCNQNVEAKFSCDICGASFTRRDKLLRHAKQKHAEDQQEVQNVGEFNCSFCDKSYTLRKNLLKHCRQIHPHEGNAEAANDTLETAEDVLEEMPGKKSKLACPECSKSYSSQSNLNRHIKEKHPDIHEPNASIDCPKCELKFTRVNLLTGHLEDDHDYQDDKKELLFPNMDDFKKWKDEMEKETLSSFVQPRGASEIKAGTRFDYICHRSGVFHERGTQGRHFHLQTRKCGHVCPARLTVTASEDLSVKVMWHKNHFGHEVGIRFLRLTEAERSMIRKQVFEGKSFQRILDDVRDAALERGHFGRLSVLQRRDLWNIMRGYVMSTKRAHHHDYLSVEAIVRGYSKKKSNPVLFYKPQDRPCECGEAGCSLKDEDFMLVLSTPWQREVFHKYASKQVLIDSTHGTNGYEFQLTTLMSVDESGVGVPLAFCLSNHVDTAQMVKFFEVIKKHVGVVKTKTFMSDMAAAYYNAWEAVMTPVQNRLFCSWHVLRAWKTNIVKVKGFEKQVEVYRAACVLMNMMDLELFHICLAGFKNMLDEDEDMKVFAEYFRDHYLKNVECWAACYRLGLGLNTNMFLEAMHKKLKYSYMDGKQLRRIDECIDILMRYARDIAIEQVTRVVKGNDSKRNRRIIDSHKRSVEQFTGEMVEQTGDSWRVQSSRGPPLFHQVTVNLDDHCLGCQLACMRCRICIHSYHCTCEDFLIRNNMCKHIHSVARFTSNEASCEFNEGNICRQIDEHMETLFETAPEVSHVSEAVQGPEIWDTVSSNLKFLMDNCSATWDRTVLDLSVSLISALEKRLPKTIDRSQVAPITVPNPCTPAKRLQGKENTGTPGSATPSRMVPGASPLTPHNLKVTPQRRPGFHSTKAPTAKRSLTLGKPNEVEAQAILTRLVGNGTSEQPTNQGV